MSLPVDLEAVFRILNEEGVEYIVIGGQAEVFYGSARVTQDADFCHRRTQENLERLARALKRMDVHLRNAPRDLPFQLDAQSLALGDNFTFVTKYGDVDFLGYVEPIGGYEDLLPRVEAGEFEGAAINVIAIDDLIRIKQHIRRPKDRDSLLHLAAIKQVRDQPLGDAAHAEGQVQAALHARFERAMMDIFKRAKTEAGYNATRYLHMLHEHGGLKTAQILLAANAVSDGYTSLWERGRLDLTVEALVCDHAEFQRLFSAEEIQIAARRLKEYKYAPRQSK